MSIVCSKCKIEKPLDQYQTYFHSTQQKMRTRKVCTPCLKEQQRLWKKMNKKKPQLETPVPVILVDYSINPDYKKCSKCLDWKLKTEYYKYPKGTRNYYSSSCINCSRERESIRNNKIRIENGGSKVVRLKPNQYSDEYQKENTFEVMGCLGYIYNEEFGIWTKPGWKEIKNGKAFFPKLQKGRNWVPKKISSEQIEQMLSMRKSGKTYKQIHIKLGLSIATVHRYCNE